MNRKRYGAFESVVRGARERKEVAVHEVAVQELDHRPRHAGRRAQGDSGLPGRGARAVRPGPAHRARLGAAGHRRLHGRGPDPAPLSLPGAHRRRQLRRHLGPRLLPRELLPLLRQRDGRRGGDSHPRPQARVARRRPRRSLRRRGDGRGPGGRRQLLRLGAPQLGRRGAEGGRAERPHRRARLLRLPGQVRALALGRSGVALRLRLERRARHPGHQHRAGDLVRQRRSSSSAWPPAGSAASRSGWRNDAVLSFGYDDTGDRGGERDQDRRHHLVGQPARHAQLPSVGRVSTCRWGSTRRCGTTRTTSPFRCLASRAPLSAWAASPPTRRRTPARAAHGRSRGCSPSPTSRSARACTCSPASASTATRASAAGTPGGSIPACRPSSRSDRRPSSRPRSVSTPRRRSRRTWSPRRSGTRISPTSGRCSTASASIRSSPSTSTSG